MRKAMNAVAAFDESVDVTGKKPKVLLALSRSLALIDSGSLDVPPDMSEETLNLESVMRAFAFLAIVLSFSLRIASLSSVFC